jgi:hypothetical protein
MPLFLETGALRRKRRGSRSPETPEARDTAIMVNVREDVNLETQMFRSWLSTGGDQDETWQSGGRP